MLDLAKLQNRHWTLAERPVAGVEDRHFRLETSPVPQPGEGEFVVRTLFLSLAPVMRRYMIDGAGIEPPMAIGDTMYGRGVGEVVTSNHPDFAVGDCVHGKLGWQEFALTDGGDDKLMFKVSERGVPPYLFLGALGITGYSAYFGLFDISPPKTGETVLVSGAAGGVGSVVGPLAKLHGCRVIGIAGSDEKCALLTDRLRYDAAINYRGGNIEEAIGEAAPDGIDVFFDNVGGEILDAALLHLNRYARITSCGRISQYIDDDYALKNWALIGGNRAKLEGFFVYDYRDRFSEAERDLAKWHREGKLPVLVDIVEGLEAMPSALMRLYDGANVGKQVVKVADPLFLPKNAAAA